MQALLVTHHTGVLDAQEILVECRARKTPQRSVTVAFVG